MKKVNDILFALLRNAMMNEEIHADLFNGVTDDEWMEIYKRACQHGVAAILVDGIKGLPLGSRPSRDIWIQWVGASATISQAYDARVGVIKDLARTYAGAGIDLMVLKGYGLSLYYPVPQWRRFSDVDIFLNCKLEVGDAVAEKELGVKVSDDVHHHTTFVYKGVLVENHFDFINTRAHRSNVWVESWLKKFVDEDVREVSVEGEKVLLPGADFNAMFLMRHMALHFSAERVSLKFFMDWMMFLKAESTRVGWDRMRELFEKYNMIKFVDAVSGICVAHFGMPSEWAPGLIRDVALEERIISDVMDPKFFKVCPADSTGFMGLCRVLSWKLRRYFANSWKHKYVFNEWWGKTFFTSLMAHVEKPGTFRH